MVINPLHVPEAAAFVTPSEVSQQVGFLRPKMGHQIPAHIHPTRRREVWNTTEVLVLTRGRMRIDFYSNDGSYVVSRMVESGHVIVLLDGGHGMVILEDSEIVEVKQGPYAGREEDKVRIASVPDCALRF